MPKSGNPSTEVEKVDYSGLSPETRLWATKTESRGEILSLARRLDAEAVLDSTNAIEIFRQVSSNIMDAEDIEAVFAAANQGTISGKEFVGTPFLLRHEDLSFRKSRFGLESDDFTKFPFYCFMNVTKLETGERLPITCGGYVVVLATWKLRELGALEAAEAQGGMCLELVGKQTQAGYTFLQIKAGPKVTTARNADPSF
jgi:hypothetical protein